MRLGGTRTRLGWVAVLAVMIGAALPSCGAPHDAWANKDNVDYTRAYATMAQLDAGVVNDPNYARVLDIYWPTGSPSATPLPVLLQLPGSGWVGGEGHSMEGKRFLDAGFAIVNVRAHRANQALGPHWPELGYDVDLAFRWVYHHADLLGFDRSRIIAMGGSAGGHLTASIGTSGAFTDPNAPSWLTSADRAARPAGLVLLIGAYNLYPGMIPTRHNSQLSDEQMPGSAAGNLIGCDLAVEPTPAECMRRLRSASFVDNPADLAMLQNFPRSFIYQPQDDDVTPVVPQSFIFSLMFCDAWDPAPLPRETHYLFPATGGHALKDADKPYVDQFLSYWNPAIAPPPDPEDPDKWKANVCHPGEGVAAGAAEELTTAAAPPPPEEEPTASAATAALADSAALVSANSAGTNSGSSDSMYPVISPDGSKVAFASEANDLVAGDGNNKIDVFVRDLATATTTLVSANGNGSASGAGSSSQPAFSPDGTKVVFVSDAADLLPAGGPTDANNAIDVFVRDLASGTTSLVSARADGTTSANGDSWRPVWSPDSSKVAFESWAGDFGPADAHRADRDGDGIADYDEDVYVRTLASTVNATQLVSVRSAGGGSGSGRSVRPVFSPTDSTKIAFNSEAGNLAPGTTDSARPTVPQMDVYLRDLDQGGTGQTTLVSTTSGGSTSGNSASRDPVFSHDGTKVAFVSSADNLDSTVTADAHRLRTWTDQAGNAHPEQDVYEFDQDVYVRDLTAGTTRLASINTAGNGSGDKVSHTPVFSTTDSNKLAFVSTSGNLAPNAGGAQSKILLHDLVTRSSLLASPLTGLPDTTADNLGRVEFSPNGNKLAYLRRSTSNFPDGPWYFDIYVRDLTLLHDQSAVELATPNSSGQRGAGVSHRPAFPANNTPASNTTVLFTSDRGDFGPNDTAKCRPQPDRVPSAPNVGCFDVYVHTLPGGGA